jgi:predicted metal-dependent phosphoesterase TrpH
MFADMHIHSTYSDGWYTPDELCARAVKNGVGLISVTDHDTLGGDSEKRKAAEKYGLLYVTGWEISAYENGEKVHVLGYGCKVGDAYLAFNEKRKQSALKRAKESVEKCNALGIPVTLQDVLAERAHTDAPVHTMHIARALVKYLGISEGEVYLKYLARGCPANSAFGRPTPKEGIDCIHALGGIAVVAHPGRLGFPFEEREAYFQTLADYGVDGIESYYTTHTEKDTEYFLKTAKKYGFFVTGGSDTHVEMQSHTIGFPRFTPSQELLERLL